MTKEAVMMTNKKIIVDVTKKDIIIQWGFINSNIPAYS